MDFGFNLDLSSLSCGLDLAFIFTFMAFGRYSYPEKLTFISFIQLRVKSLTHNLLISSLTTELPQHLDYLKNLIT